MHFGIGIVGATGYVGVPYRREIRACADTGLDVEIVALCARRRDRLEAAAVEDTASLMTDDWREVVNHPDVNLVLVLTPDALHYEPALATLEMGKMLLCEKPVGGTSVEAREISDAARRMSAASFIPFWTRYVPLFRRTKEIVAEGKLGAVRSVIYRWQNPRPVEMPFTWRDNAELSSAGSIADVGSHAYDTLRYILGKEASRVLTHAQVVMPSKPDLGEVDLQEAIEWGQDSSSAKVDDKKKGDVPDYAQIAMEYADGMIGSILLSHASYLRRGFAPELELHGTKASLSVDRIRQELWIADSPAPARLFEKVTDNGHCNRFEHRVFPALDQQLAGKGSGEHPDLTDGYRVQLFTDAAYLSSQRGTWVDLPSE